MEGKRDKPCVLLFLLLTAFGVYPPALAQRSYDSLRANPPKHYFNTIIVLDGYNRKSTDLDTAGKINKHLQNYGIRQINLSFCIPLLTRDFKGRGKDSNVVENAHLLLTGNFLTLQPEFGGISQHRLSKRGIGIRYIYNTGKKGVFFFDASPFVTRDLTYRSRAYFRLASTFIYSYNASKNFNIRVGATKSFLWGNRFYLPFIGIRVGALDKVNISLQFPRYISLNLPLGSKFQMSVYSKAQGGMFNFSNHDTLYPRSTEATFHFTYYEINTGLRCDARFGSRMSLFVCAGLSTQNNITFYSELANKNRPRVPYQKYFYESAPPPTVFGQLGLVFKLGRTRSYYNNRNLYDAIDLNNAEDLSNGNIQIPRAPRKAPKNLNLESIQDLIDYNDF